MDLQLPLPKNEMERLIQLAGFDLDYSDLSVNFKDLTKLAAKVAGTDVSLVNLIDSYTQWTVANHGLDVDQMSRADSVCQYTITEDDHFEVEDLTADERFNDKFYVTHGPKLKYYYGVPLKSDGKNIGALCVLDTDRKKLTPEKTEMLKLIANEVMNRLNTLKALDNLQKEAKEASENTRRIAHDIRGPLGGIIGLAQIIKEQGNENNMEEVLEFITLIHKSGHSILELADEILTTHKNAQPEVKLAANSYNLLLLKEKLLKLYAPQALNKDVRFTVNIAPPNESVAFSKNKLLQIIGNLISNAIKFTPAGGAVSVTLNLLTGQAHNTLEIIVQDSGVGMDQDKVDTILNGVGETTIGTGGEKGYGFGLALVKHLVDSLKGSLYVVSSPGKGTDFTLKLPQA
ncbi:GAF domain-containing sensor histidine kinase [Mucilaginibacter sp. KACC 22063]|uniref:GAF domain-containing sensor histidine kinase n=1 Tax=Mucilaginibacter sp. KACC 22063 TaxID=3025666 RepID=UPI00236510D0|nr:GAF domain-containing sensor histidine kinase [Mucilaginibacter sp. KACC 22063]WDF55190.1 GAF domain-containing sensor histidine kinase [Mucilaginibacter sp. KACC 22063]